MNDKTTDYGSWVEAYKRDAAHLAEAGMYRPESETAACGVGMVASIDGTPRRDVVLRAIDALRALWHRGAVDADGKTGDGAGIHVQIPQDFFKEHVRRTGHELGRGLVAYSSEEVDKIRGMSITVVTSAENDDESRALLAKIGMPFRKSGAS